MQNSNKQARYLLIGLTGSMMWLRAIDLHNMPLAITLGTIGALMFLRALNKLYVF